MYPQQIRLKYNTI